MSLVLEEEKKVFTLLKLVIRILKSPKSKKIIKSISSIWKKLILNIKK